MIASGVFIQVRFQKMLGTIGAGVPIFFGPVSRILGISVVQWVVLVHRDHPQMLLKLELLGTVGSLKVPGHLCAQGSHGVYVKPSLLGMVSSLKVPGPLGTVSSYVVIWQLPVGKAEHLKMERDGQQLRWYAPSPNDP